MAYSEQSGSGTPLGSWATISTIIGNLAIMAHRVFLDSSLVGLLEGRGFLGNSRQGFLSLRYLLVLPFCDFWYISRVCPFVIKFLLVKINQLP